jgi:hypothetical protein
MHLKLRLKQMLLLSQEAIWDSMQLPPLSLLNSSLRQD